MIIIIFILSLYQIHEPHRSCSFQLAFTLLIFLHLSNATYVYTYTRTHIFNSILIQKNAIHIPNWISHRDHQHCISLSLSVPQHCKPFHCTPFSHHQPCLVSASNPILLLFLLFTRWHDFIVNASPVIIIIINNILVIHTYLYIQIYIFTLYTYILHVCLSNFICYVLSTCQ